jgi:Mn-containing catalase
MGHPTCGSEKGEAFVFIHNKKLQFRVRIDKPDPIFAGQLQELLGGKYGEMTVMMQYLLQGWGLRGDLEDPRLRKIKDMLLDTGTEEIAHVEMLATCISMLLTGASPSQQDAAAQRDPLIKATLGGMNPQQFIAAGLGPMAADSMGNPWNGAYATASGNVVADLYNNAQAEMNGRLQACRMLELTNDGGVRDMLTFMIGRDHMHQIQWLAAIEELGGVTATLPVPASFPLERENGQYALAFMGYSNDPDCTSGAGRWAQGPSIDGKGTFSYIAEPTALGEAPHLPSVPDGAWNNLADQGMDGGSGMTGAVPGYSKQVFEAKTGAKEEKRSLVDRIVDTVAGSETEQTR